MRWPTRKIIRVDDHSRFGGSYPGGVDREMSWARRHPFVVDGLLAAVLVLGFGHLGPDGHTAAGLAIAVVMGAALTVRRRWPTQAFVVVAIAAGFQFVLDVPAQVFDVALVVALYTVAATRSRREALVALVVVELGVFAASMWWSNEPARAVFGPAVLAVAAVLLGNSMRLRRAYLHELEERAARLEFERDQQAQIAAAAERSRIARELHDIVAHSLSVMVAQADGASYTIDSDLARAKGAVLSIAQTGRDALTEMRRLLGVLRESDTGSGVAPQPGVEQLGELVDSVRRAGLRVQLTLTGDPRPLPRGLELTAYRIMQEALTNTLKHGGANPHAWVTIEYGADAVALRIEDDGVGAGALVGASSEPGQGLVGMRERAAVYGGSVETGERPGGGFRVVARLPLPPP
jgi:signal transduction histidine kinase